MISKTDDIDGQKVKRVMIMIELENGKTLIARPTEIGKVDSLVTLKDLQRTLSNNKGDDDTRFISPSVWVDDLRDAGRRWIEELDESQYGDDARKLSKWGVAKVDGLCVNCGEYTCDNMKDLIKHIFNLEDEDV